MADGNFFVADHGSTGCECQGTAGVVCPAGGVPQPRPAARLRRRQAGPRRRAQQGPAAERHDESENFCGKKAAVEGPGLQSKGHRRSAAEPPGQPSAAGSRSRTVATQAQRACPRLWMRREAMDLVLRQSRMAVKAAAGNPPCMHRSATAQAAPLRRVRLFAYTWGLKTVALHLVAGNSRVPTELRISSRSV